MIQDIGEERLRNEYRNIKPKQGDQVFCFIGENVLNKKNEEGMITFPTIQEIRERDQGADFVYLFAIGKNNFFLHLRSEIKAFDDYNFSNVRTLRQNISKEMCFAAATAYHLYVWYRDNNFCGRCGQHMYHADNERMLRCPVCGLMVFPKVAPAVIVAVIDGDRILMTKYAGRAYKNYALIAGFTEIGETAEETVTREVMEEVGVKVKDIVYYKSQPWGTDSNLLLGYVATLDGDDTLKVDENELSIAEWVKREDIDLEDDGISLTREMIIAFKNKKI